MILFRTMLTLAIETSNPSAWTPRSRARPGVALRWESSPSRDTAEPVKIDDPHFDDLAGAISRLCARESVAPREITHVAVSVGPGGYTATRLSVVTAKMIAEATGAHCIPIPTAEVVALTTLNNHRPFAVALASKGPTAHVTLFNPDRTPRAPGTLMDAAAFAALNLPLLVADSFLPADFRALCAPHALEIHEPEFDPLACAALAHRHTPVDPTALEPLYPREPEAVTKWRELHARRARNP